jgi:hypothetical protein
MYYVLEGFSYLIFFGLICIAFYLPDYLALELEPIFDKEELISMPEWHFVILSVRIFLLFLCLFPLGAGLLIHSSRRKSGKMYEINKIASGLVSKSVGNGNA